MTDGVHQLDDSRFVEAAGVLARSFLDYPMWQWILPDEQHRQRVMPLWSREAIIWGQLAGETVVVGSPIHGIALWARPGMADIDVDPDSTLGSNWPEVEDAIGPTGVRRFEMMVDIQRPLREKHIPPGGWYLSCLGVDPARQRSGAGSALLNDMFARLDADGVATFLETEKAANVPYYLKHGYEIVHEGGLPDGGPAYWCFLREPQQGRAIRQPD